MYKEILITIIVVISIIGLNWFLQDYTKKSVTAISDKLIELKGDLKEGNEEVIKEKMSKTHDLWDRKYRALAIFIEHDELEKVETQLVALESYMEVNDYNMGINELDKGVFVLKHIAEKYDFALINVF